MKAAMTRSASKLNDDPTTGADLGAGPGAGAMTGDTAGQASESSGGRKGRRS